LLYKTFSWCLRNKPQNKLTNAPNELTYYSLNCEF
jgi:hypothetical protein